jgi:hypothetical protein
MKKSKIQQHYSEQSRCFVRREHLHCTSRSRHHHRQQQQSTCKHKARSPGGVARPTVNKSSAWHAKRERERERESGTHLPPLPAAPPSWASSGGRGLREQHGLGAQQQGRPEPAATVVEVEGAGVRELAEEPVRDVPRHQLHQQVIVAGGHHRCCRRPRILLHGGAAQDVGRRRRGHASSKYELAPAAAAGGLLRWRYSIAAG